MQASMFQGRSYDFGIVNRTLALVASTFIARLTAGKADAVCGLTTVLDVCSFVEITRCFFMPLIAWFVAASRDITLYTSLFYVRPVL